MMVISTMSIASTGAIYLEAQKIAINSEGNSTIVGEIIYVDNNMSTLIALDSDYDGFPDSVDPFPNDPTEWWDLDQDGWGDNRDHYPYDSSEWLDTDLDGIGDNEDLCDRTIGHNMDFDGDSIGDICDSDIDNDGVSNDLDREVYGNAVGDYTIFMGVTSKNDGRNNIDEPYMYVNYTGNSVMTTWEEGYLISQSVTLDLPEPSHQMLAIAVSGWDYDGQDNPDDHYGDCSLQMPILDECVATSMKVLVINNTALRDDPATQSRVAAWVNDGVVSSTDESEWSSTMRGLVDSFESAFSPYLSVNTIHRFVIDFLLSFFGLV